MFLLLVDSKEPSTGEEQGEDVEPLEGEVEADIQEELSAPPL